jgi:hypothetical protein
MVQMHEYVCMCDKMRPYGCSGSALGSAGGGVASLSPKSWWCPLLEPFSAFRQCAMGHDDEFPPLRPGLKVSHTSLIANQLRGCVKGASLA